MTGTATRLMHFGVFLAHVDPALASTRDLRRRRHIEPYLTSLTTARSLKDDEPITVGDRARRVLAVSCFLTDITEWGWEVARSQAAVP